eukprot:15020801-Heterocapsa_arctica.AAC.1
MSFEEGAQPALGGKTMAALLHVYPAWGASIGEAFPCAARSLKGWHALRPARTRQPLPFLSLMAIAGLL